MLTAVHSEHTAPMITFKAVQRKQSAGNRLIALPQTIGKAAYFLHDIGKVLFVDRKTGKSKRRLLLRYYNRRR